jgi:hypothetical protein
MRWRSRIAAQDIVSKEVVLNWNNAIRQVHRWLSIAFTVAVIVNIVAMTQQQQPALWIGLLALLPLVLLLITGLYMFVLPYVVKAANGSREKGARASA